MAAMETEIESAEKKIDDYEQNEAHIKHIILLTLHLVILQRSKLLLPQKKCGML